MASVWGELRRRNVISVGGAYIVGAWLLIEAASVLGPALDLPDLAINYVTFFAILGFPIALIMAWAYELTPDGISPTSRAPTANSITYSTGRKFDFVIIGLMAMGIVFLLVDNYVREEPAESDLAADAPAEVSAPVVVAERRDVLPNSVAVLPFDNLSLDPEEAFFAAGIHEELLNQLAKFRALNVIARTSMLQYAGGEKSIPQIAYELNVETVMEGSVRYANNRVLVTAQLIDPRTNAHLWADSYNREFSDIFAIQADIAMNIANALQAEFSPAEQARVEKISTESPEAYASYLKALSGSESWRSDLEQAIALDPNFALAYALKAQRYAYQGRFVDSPNEVADWERIAREAVEQAMALDSTLGFAHVAVGILHESAGNVVEARRSFEQAYQLSPRDRIVLEWYARFQRHTGQYAEATRVGQQALELNPYDWYLYHQLAVTYRYAKNYDASAASARKSIEVDPARPSPRVGLAIAEIVRGNIAEAVAQLQIAETLGGNVSNFRVAQMALAYGQAGRPEDAVRLFNVLEDRAKETLVSAALWAKAYLAVSDYDEVFRRLETAINDPVPADIVMLAQVKANAWRDRVLEEESRFLSLRDRIGVF